MSTNKYITDKLMMNQEIKNFLDWMHKEGHGCYVAGGAITCIATGKHDDINDYDIYFTDKHSAVAAIRYMKEDNCHVSFVSDKSISYAKNAETKIQFIYTDFYPTAEDIFRHFDFTINMGAYDSRDKKVYTDENFWMHNAQRFLSVNTKTLFPIISQLRLDKYLKKGYKTSRNEMLKLSLAVANLSITTWKQAKEQMGNTYGFTLADFEDCDKTPFSMEALLERIDSPSDTEQLPIQQQYLYPHDVVDFVILGEPIEYTVINGEEYLVDGYAADVEISIDRLVEDNVLTKVEVDSSKYLSGDWYAFAHERVSNGESLPNWRYTRVMRKDKLGNHSSGLVYKVEFTEDQIVGFDGDSLDVNSPKVVELICRSNQVYSFKKGDVVFRENAKMKPHSAKKVDPQLTPERIKHINDHTISTGGMVMYARNSFEGVILEGGEDITADELLYLRDGCGLPFGGSCHINSNGKYSGEYNTD
ncbi:hypothetical protein [Vibrio phage S4-7]|nr:hypothetical protein [Vibrio phage S4-7]